MSELLPCPFCGTVPNLEDDAYHYQNQGNKWGGIRCCIDGPEVRTNYKPWPHWKDEAIKEWNTRAPQKQWVSVDERLPDRLEVRAKLRDGSEVNCWYQSNGDYYWKGGGSEVFILECQVTHWQPQPPEGG